MSGRDERLPVWELASTRLERAVRTVPLFRFSLKIPPNAEGFCFILATIFAGRCQYGLRVGLSVLHAVVTHDGTLPVLAGSPSVRR